MEIVNNFAGAEEPIANAFFQQYYLSMLQDTFFVLTDSDHKSGKRLGCAVHNALFTDSYMYRVQAPEFDVTETVPVGRVEWNSRTIVRPVNAAQSACEQPAVPARIYRNSA